MASSMLNKINSSSIVRGIVVDNNDPENRGRVKIRIPSYHGVVGETRNWTLDSELPWANPGLFASGGNDVGQRIIPTTGTRIFVMFEEGDLAKPIYFGGLPQLIGGNKLYNANDSSTLAGNVVVATNDTMADIDYSRSQANQGVLFKSLKGFTIYYDDTDGHEVVKIIDQAGQMIKMESLSPIYTRRGDSENAEMASRITIKNNSDTLITIDDTSITMNVQGTEIIIDGTDGVDILI
jgi:hypothetical protein